MPVWGGMARGDGGDGGGLGGLLKKASPWGAAAGLLEKIGGGIFGSLFNRGKEKREAENNRLLMQHGIDTRNLSRKRKASMVGSLLRTWAANPKVYGSFVKPDMFGYTPGPLTETDLVDPAAPKLKPQSNLSALVQGIGSGAASYMNDDEAARNEEIGRIRG